MNREKLVLAAKDLINKCPDIGRYDLAAKLDVSEWAARELLRELRHEPIGLRVAYWDIETTSLRPEMGRVICSVICSFPSMEYHVLRQDDIAGLANFTDDRKIVKQTRDILERHHIIMGWYSKGFDVPFLNTRLVSHGERKLKNHLHFDPYYCHKGWHGIKPTRGSLEAAVEFYGLDERKYKVDKRVWADASIGKRYAMDIIAERCKSDVRLLAQIVEKTFDADLPKNITRYA